MRRTKMRSGGRLLASMGCALALLPCAAGAQTPPAASDSPVQAEVLLNTTGWNLLDYAWQTPTTLLVIRGTKRAPHAALVDIETKRETPLDTLDRLFAASPSAEKLGWQLSPDRSKLLWVEKQKENAAFRVAALDGSKTVTWDRGLAGKPALFIDQPWWTWRPDSQGWLEATRLLYTPADATQWASVEATNGSLHARYFLIDTPTKVLDVIPTGSKSHYQQPPHISVVGFNGQKRLVVLEWPDEAHPGPFRLLDYDALYHTAPSRGYTMQFPPDATPTEVVISPSGQQLAWLLYRRESDRMEIWISNWIGRDFRPFGGQSGTPFKRGEVSELRWTPDEQRLTYLHRNTLSAVMAPPPPPVPHGYGSPVARSDRNPAR